MSEGEDGEKGGWFQGGVRQVVGLWQFGQVDLPMFMMFTRMSENV